MISGSTLVPAWANPAWTSDGTLHDSSIARGKPSLFPLNRTALKGFGECVQLMAVGDPRISFYDGVPRDQVTTWIHGAHVVVENVEINRDFYVKCGAGWSLRVLNPDVSDMRAAVRERIVTASPDVIVAPFARALGADLLIGTQLAHDPDGRVKGARPAVTTAHRAWARRLAR